MRRWGAEEEQPAEDAPREDGHEDLHDCGDALQAVEDLCALDAGEEQGDPLQVGHGVEEPGAQRGEGAEEHEGDEGEGGLPGLPEDEGREGGEAEAQEVEEGEDGAQQRREVQGEEGEERGAAGGEGGEEEGEEGREGEQEEGRREAVHRGGHDVRGEHEQQHQRHGEVPRLPAQVQQRARGVQQRGARRGDQRELVGERAGRGGRAAGVPGGPVLVVEVGGVDEVQRGELPGAQQVAAAVVGAPGAVVGGVVCGRRRRRRRRR